MKIVTDCAADMSRDELQQLDVAQAPLFIQFPEGEVNSADMTIDAFYDRLEAMRPQVPTTAQPSSGVFADLYRTLAKTDSEILSIHISSGLSGTLNSARLGGQQVAPSIRVTPWDSMTLAGGLRFQVMAAALASRAGWTLQAIQERLGQIRTRTEVVYTLDTLEYLARGGRIGRVQALAGALLNLKPVIRVDHEDGKYSTAAKSRTLARAVATIAEHLQSLYGSTSLWVAVQHGRFAEEADAMAQRLKETLAIAKIETIRISPVLGVHTGPGIVGASVVPFSLMSDLI